MALIKKGEAMPERPIIIVIYGTPGAGKTSLSNTSKNPILLDCDRGADRSVHRKDVLLVKNWNEVLTDEEHIKGHSTLIIDTAKAVLDDFLMNYVIKEDYKLAKNKLKAYGAIGEEFKLFVNRQREKNIDIIILAHSKDEKDGDLVKISPDVTGQSKDLVLRIADQVGFLTIENNKRVINFEPTDKTIGKNVARLDKLEIPDERDPSFVDFMDTVIKNVKESISTRDGQQQKILAESELLINKINEIITPMDADNVFLDISSSANPNKQFILAEFVSKTKELKFIANKTTKKYEYDSKGNNAGEVQKVSNGTLNI